jgi:hypothetical protein
VIFTNRTAEITPHPGPEGFIGTGRYRYVPWYGGILIAIGAIVTIVAIASFASCTGTELLLLGVAILLVGAGFALVGGLPAIYLMGPLGIILLAIGFGLRIAGSC